MNKQLLFLSTLIIINTQCIFQKQSAIIPKDASLSKEKTESLLLDDILKKPITDMTFDEAARVKAYYEQQEKDDFTVKCCERMIALSTDPELTQQALLQAAQIYLAQGKLKKAEQHAKDYEILYPGTEQAQDAAYIALKSSFLSMLDPDRDQTPTQQTLTLAHNFIDNYKHNNKYQQSVQDIMDNCYVKLIDSELGIADNYLAKYDYSGKAAALKAAENRLAYIKEKLLPHTQAQEPRIIEMEIKLAQSQQKPDLIASKEQELQNKYPQYAARQKSLMDKIKQATLKF